MSLLKQTKSSYNPSTSPDRRINPDVGRPRPRELNHLFVSNVRFWSMLSIVVLHSVQAVQLVSAQPQLRLGLPIPFKFATIGFFLISGFLLGERVDRRDPVEYFMRRVKRVFVPWLLWFGLMSCMLATEETFTFHAVHSPFARMIRIAYFTSRSALINTSFWFVPNLLLSIAILLIFRRHLYSLAFGAVLLAANIIYAVNTYTLWFTSQHTQAIFGFVFYLWLGSYCAQNFAKVSALLARIPTSACLALTAISALASYGETQLLFALHKPDPLSTLRFTNQIFSVCMVLVIFKFSRATWPRFVDVRRHTFGIYLTHSIVLQFFVYHLGRIHWQPAHSSLLADGEGILLWIALSLVTYLCCLLITAWLSSTPSLQWTVGLTPQDSTPRSLPVFVTAPGALPVQ